MENNEIKTTPEVSIEELKKKYKKHNPFIFGDKNLASKKFRNAYISVKLSIVFLIAIFGMVGLWFTTQWQSNAITNLGIDLNSSTLSFSVWEQGTDGNWTLTSTQAFASMIGEKASGVVKDTYNNMLTLGIWEFATAQSNYKMMIEAIIGLGFVGIIFIIPSLTFKNGTAYSVGSLSVVFICLVAIITMFSILLNYEMELVNTFKGATFTYDFGGYKVGDVISDEEYQKLASLDEQHRKVAEIASQTLVKYFTFVLGKVPA